MANNGYPKPPDKDAATCSPKRNEFVLNALDRFERPLTEYALRIFQGDLHAARDSVQYTFMQLCRQKPEKVESKLRPWLYSVCRNHILDQLKSKRCRTTTNPKNFDAIDYRALDPAGQFELDDILTKLKSICGCLSESERSVIDLWSHGFNAIEIAELLERTPGSVRVSLHRAIKRLQKHPFITNWLERATGQVVKPDAGNISTSKYNGTQTPTITGKQP